ncbi:hypothetical protein FB645_002797 [Coemansia sp. IMI 203386]|nr:hypothetical protein FB645_002797 [Coemansia sp. IMI 203386]
MDKNQLGIRLFSEHGYERHIDYESARNFMNKVTIGVFNEADALADATMALQMTANDDNQLDHFFKKRK